MQRIQLPCDLNKDVIEQDELILLREAIQQLINLKFVKYQYNNTNPELCGRSFIGLVTSQASEIIPNCVFQSIKFVPDIMTKTMFKHTGQNYYLKMKLPIHKKIRVYNDNTLMQGQYSDWQTSLYNDQDGTTQIQMIPGRKLQHIHTANQSVFVYGTEQLVPNITKERVFELALILLKYTIIDTKQQTTDIQQIPILIKHITELETTINMNQTRQYQDQCSMLKRIEQLSSDILVLQNQFNDFKGFTNISIPFQQQLDHTNIQCNQNNIDIQVIADESNWTLMNRVEPQPQVIQLSNQIDENYFQGGSFNPNTPTSQTIQSLEIDDKPLKIIEQINTNILIQSLEKCQIVDQLIQLDDQLFNNDSKSRNIDEIKPWNDDIIQQTDQLTSKIDTLIDTINIQQSGSKGPIKTVGKVVKKAIVNKNKKDPEMMRKAIQLLEDQKKAKAESNIHKQQ